MIDLDPTDRITIAGLPGTGKTTFAKYLADLFKSTAGTSILIYDPLDQYRTFADEERYIPESDSLAEFESVCKRLSSVRNTVFIIDEAEAYLTEGYLSNTYAYRLVWRGRNWGVGIVAVTRRLQDLSKRYFMLCNHAFFFRCHPMVRDYLKKFLEPEALRMIMGLAKYDFLHYDMQTHRYQMSGLELPPPDPMAAARAKLEAEALSQARIRNARQDSHGIARNREEPRGVEGP